MNVYDMGDVIGSMPGGAVMVMRVGSRYKGAWFRI
jgi:hypothetical protein